MKISPILTKQNLAYSQPKGYKFAYRADFVSFSANYRLLNKYGIDAENVPVISTQDADLGLDEKKELIEKILEAHELAQKNKLTGNITGSAYATNAQMKNGTWVLGTNFNNTRNEISNFCGERSAVVGAFNKWLGSLSLSRLKNDKDYAANLNQNRAFKLKCIAMSSYKEIGTDKNAAAPCADCLSWLNTLRFFDDDTRIATLSKDEKGQYVLLLRTVKDYLPKRDEINSLITNDKKLEDLEFAITDEAKAALKKHGIKKEELRELIAQAKNSYESESRCGFSNQNVAAAVLDDTHDSACAKKLDWSKRWFMEPLEFASAKVLENKGNDTKIIACAYYGSGLSDDGKMIHKDGVVSLQSLGRIKTKRGSGDTLVATVVDNKIAIHTINNYMSEKFSFVQDYLKS